MSVICLDTYSLKKDNTPFYKGVHTYTKEEAKSIAKELQMGYMKLLSSLK